MKKGTFLFLISLLLLSACDPLASKSVTIRLKDQAKAPAKVLQIIDDALSQAGFRNESKKSDGKIPAGGFYEGGDR